MELRKLLLRTLVCSSALILSCNIFTPSNSNVIEGAYDDFNEAPVAQLRSSHIGGDAEISYSDIYAQYGLDEDNNYWIRFATAVKGDIDTIHYERGAIETFNETGPVVKSVTSVYQSVLSNGEEKFYNPETGLSTDESDSGVYYWACYSIKISNPSYYYLPISMTL